MPTGIAYEHRGVIFAKESGPRQVVEDRVAEQWIEVPQPARLRARQRQSGALLVLSPDDLGPLLDAAIVKRATCHRDLVSAGWQQPCRRLSSGAGKVGARRRGKSLAQLRDFPQPG